MERARLAVIRGEMEETFGIHAIEEDEKKHLRELKKLFRRSLTRSWYECFPKLDGLESHCRGTDMSEEGCGKPRR